MTRLSSTLNTLRGSLSPLRYPNFRLYLGGQAISLIGTFLQSTALSWVVWQITGSEASLGVVNMLTSLPILFLAPFAGVWVDRVERRLLLIGTQFTAMMLAFILAYLTQIGQVQIWHVYTLIFLLGIVSALDMPAQQAFLGDLSGSGDLRKAINLNIMILQISRILGPAMAGVVVARLGTGPAFWLNGLSFAAVIVSLILVRARQQRKAVSNVNPIRQIAEGVDYVRTQPRMIDLFIIAALLTFFVFAIVMNVLPAVADKVLGGNAETLGALLASSGAGALFAVIVIVPITQAMKRSGLVMAVALFWIAFWLTILANSRVLPLSMFALAMGSMGAPTVMTMAQGLLQLMAPPQMRGRIISLFTTVSFGMQPIAALWVGQTAERLGVSVAIQINAVLLAVGAVGMVAFRPALLRWVWSDSVVTDDAPDAPNAPTAAAPAGEPALPLEEAPMLAGD